MNVQTMKLWLRVKLLRAARAAAAGRPSRSLRCDGSWWLRSAPHLAASVTWPTASVASLLRARVADEDSPANPRWTEFANTTRSVGLGLRGARQGVRAGRQDRDRRGERVHRAQRGLRVLGAR